MKEAPWLAARVPPPSAALVSSTTVRSAPSLVADVCVPRRRRAPGRTCRGRQWRRCHSRCRRTGEAPWLHRIRCRAGGIDADRDRCPTLLVDTGGAPFGGGIDVGRRVLAPALWARGVRCSTRCSSRTAIPTISVGQWRSPRISGRTKSGKAFGCRSICRRRALGCGGALRDSDRAAAGRRDHRLDEVQLRVLHPPPPDWERRRVRNDDSVVLEVVYGDVAILLTGDISADIERAILPRLTPRARESSRSRTMAVARPLRRHSSKGGGRRSP